MRQLIPAVLLTLGALPAVASASEIVRPDAGLEGAWRAVIASPRRPWIFDIDFERRGEGWKATARLVGLMEFPLREVRLDSARVAFRFPPEMDEPRFEGKLHGDVIEGLLTEGEQTTPTRLTRIVPRPAPASRREAWQQDLDAAAAWMLEYDRSFLPARREQFRQAVTELAGAVSGLTDAEILAGLSRAVALAGNAHTRLRLDPTRGGIFGAELPLRMWWFRDGPYVVSAAPAYRRAVGCRVVALGAHGIDEARRRVQSLFAGNASWGSYVSPAYLTNPDVLHALGLTPSARQADFTFADERGARFKLRVRAEPADPGARRAESWQALAPRGAPAGWPVALAPLQGASPLYLREPRQPYWFEFLADTGLLYFQFNRSWQAEQGPSFRDFGDSLLAFVGRHPVRALVVDLRFNTGGNLEVGRELMKELARRSGLDDPGRLFVITGPCTYSAGLYHAAQLRQFSRATFVGEPVGDDLDFWAEGGRFVLPHSGAVLSYANGFHGYSGTNYPERRPYYEELRVRSLDPDLPAPLTWRDYLAGRDPALEAIAARLAR